MMEKIIRVNKSSKVLGILSICLFWLSYPSIILSIIGLCINEKESNNKALVLNIVGLIISVIYTVFILAIL